MAAMKSTDGPGMKMYVMVWLGLLLIAGVEVGLTYAHLPGGTLLAALLSLAILQAGLGIMFFMHLGYERPNLFWSLIPSLIFVLVLMNHFWRDAQRLVSLHP
jgi:cytochrome c oxidase subunit IV